ncbi:MAG: hypothetical protein WBC53_01955, partial [Phycisphaerae bacterium]
FFTFLSELNPNWPLLIPFLALSYCRSSMRPRAFFAADYEHMLKIGAARLPRSARLPAVFGLPKWQRQERA